MYLVELNEAFAVRCSLPEGAADRPDRLNVNRRLIALVPRLAYCASYDPILS